MSDAQEHAARLRVRAEARAFRARIFSDDEAVAHLAEVAALRERVAELESEVVRARNMVTDVQERRWCTLERKLAAALQERDEARKAHADFRSMFGAAPGFARRFDFPNRAAARLLVEMVWGIEAADRIDRLYTEDEP